VRPLPIVALLLTVATASAAAPLPRGNGDFRLGSFRAEVDSTVAARGLTVLSSGTAFLACASDDPDVEFEQYSFFQAPHGIVLLWRVTIGYRLGTSRADLDSVLVDLRHDLGEPSSDTGAAAERDPRTEGPLPPGARSVIWADPSTAVQLGARWSDEPPQPSDRMMVTWTDRRLQRLVEARRKKGKSGGAE
jgi:hypothetical protein